MGGDGTRGSRLHHQDVDALLLLLLRRAHRAEHPHLPRRRNEPRHRRGLHRADARPGLVPRPPRHADGARGRQLPPHPLRAQLQGDVHGEALLQHHQLPRLRARHGCGDVREGAAHGPRPRAGGGRPTPARGAAGSAPGDRATRPAPRARRGRGNHAAARAGGNQHAGDPPSCGCDHATHASQHPRAGSIRRRGDDRRARR